MIIEGSEAWKDLLGKRGYGSAPKAVSLKRDWLRGIYPAPVYVATFADLDRELRRATDGTSDLDDFVAAVVAADALLDLDSLIDMAADLLGKPSAVLRIDKLPGCATIANAATGT